ncbi:MAG: histidine kinase dimerization/phosphoacceptor domain -containing protein [Caldilineaceae bacterium]
MHAEEQRATELPGKPTEKKFTYQPLRRPQSLRWRLLTLLGAILLFTLLMIGLGVSGFVSQTEQVAWLGRQSEASRNAADTVAAFVRRVNTVLTAISLLGQNEFKSRPTLLHQLLKDNPALLEIICLDANGHLIAGAYQDAPILADLFTIPQANWFQQARAGKHYLSDLQLSANNQPYLIIAIPAVDNGVVAARLHMNVLGEILSEIRFGKTGRAYVINRVGQVIAHTNPQVVNANINLSERPELTAMEQTADKQWTGSYLNFEKVAVVGASAPVLDTDWIVITELAQDEAFAVTRRAWLLLSSGMLIFGVLILVITTKLLGRMIFEPMEKLQAGADHIGQGDLTHRIEMDRQDEVGMVAQAFNEMAWRLYNREEQLLTRTVELAIEVNERKKAEEALRKTHDELEIRVEQRTAELAQANTVLRTEIAERARAEEALRESEARYKTLFDTAPVSIFTKDIQGRYTSVNADELGYWPRNPVGYTDVELLPHTIADQLRTADLKVITTGEPLVIEEQFPTANGERILLSHKVPLRDANQNIIGILGASLDITERKFVEDQIKASLEEKVVLLQEIHHRVKNNLQVISSLLYLQSEKIKDPQILEILRDSQNRVKSMALIHEKLYQSPDLSKIDLAEYIRNLTSYLFRSYTALANAIRFEVEADNIYLGIDTATPCGLIINELVSNALKHAFPKGQGGIIRVALHRETGNLFQLVVCDTGIGFPAALDFTNTNSLGLQLVNTLVNQLDGSIELKRQPGTEFKISFPAPQ